MTSFDDASWQTNAEESPQEVSSGGSMYYNGSAHLRTFPVTFGSPLVSTGAQVLNIIYENNTEDYDTVVRNKDMSHRLSQYY